MELYIIRHGQSVNNALMEDPTLRVQDPPLTEVGKKQAECAAQFLASHPNLEQIVRFPVDDPRRKEHHPHNITHLYCSAMHRALQTANPIARALGIKPEIWLEIHEHGGIYLEKDGVISGHGGKTRVEIMEEFPEYVLPEAITEAGWWRPEDGMEDITLCHARAIRVAQALRERAADKATQDEAVALVSHGTFIDSLLKALLNLIPGERLYHWHYNTAITRLDILEDGIVVIRYINRITHLSPELIT